MDLGLCSKGLMHVSTLQDCRNQASGSGQTEPRLQLARARNLVLYERQANMAPSYQYHRWPCVHHGVSCCG